MMSKHGRRFAGVGRTPERLGEPPGDLEPPLPPIGAPGELTDLIMAVAAAAALPQRCPELEPQAEWGQARRLDKNV